SSVTSRSKPGTSAIRSASRRKSYQARSAGGPWSCAANSFRDRSSTAQESSGFVSGAVTRWLTKSGDAIWKGGGSRRHPVGWQAARRCAYLRETLPGSIVWLCIMVSTHGARRLKGDRKSTRLNSSHDQSSYAVVCLNKKRYMEASRVGA